MSAIWKFLNNKKTIIASIINQICIYLLVKDWIDPGLNTLILGVTTIITGVALGHKAAKKIGGAHDKP